MIWKTKISQMVEVRYPIIMGAFAAIGSAEFAAAFSNAGGLGIITAINYPTIEDFQKELENMSKFTKNPFGVNFTITPPYLAKKGRGKTEESYNDFLDISIEKGVKVFTTSAYQTPYLGKRIKEAGCYWFH